MKANIEYKEVLSNYCEDNKGSIFKYLQYKINFWQTKYNKKIIVYAWHNDYDTSWFTRSELENYVNHGYKDLLDDYLDDYIEITLSDLWITNYQSTNLLRNYIK